LIPRPTCGNIRQPIPTQYKSSRYVQNGSVYQEAISFFSSIQQETMRGIETLSE